MYILTCRSTEQHKPAPQCSILLLDPLWKTTQAKEVNKREKMTTQSSTETQQAHLGHMLRAREEKKNHQTAEEKAEIFKLSARPPSTSCCFPLNYLLISLSCELTVPQLCMVLLSLTLITPRTRVWPDYGNNVCLACGSIFYFDHLYSQNVLN